MPAATNNAIEIHCDQPLSSQKQATTSGIAAMRDRVRTLAVFSISAGTLARCHRCHHEHEVSPSAAKMLMNLLGQGAGDSRHRFDVFQGCGTNRTGAAKMMKERTFAGSADAWHLVERRAGDVGGAPRAMRADGE